MIEPYYKDFKIRDYMDDTVLKEQSLTDIIDCSLGTNDFIDEKIIKRCILESNYELNKYPIVEYDLLKNELTKYWNNYAYSKLSDKNIAFGSGVMGILRNLSEFLINGKTKILGCAPQFPRFISEVELKKGVYKYYSMSKKDNYKFDINTFLEKITDKYDLIQIENPNNPTGQIINITNIEKIIEKAQKYDSIVIIDEAYGDYMNPNNSAIRLVGKYENLVVLRSASKFYGLPNHRVGYLFASKEFINIYNKISIPFPFSDLSANVFRIIFKNKKILDSTKPKIAEINKKIYDNLNTNNYIYTNIETPIFTITSNKYQNLSNELRKKGLITENCDIFINLDSSYARVKIGKDWEKMLVILQETL